jgi:hypothetical protein
VRVLLALRALSGDIPCVPSGPSLIPSHQCLTVTGPLVQPSRAPLEWVTASHGGGQHSADQTINSVPARADEHMDNKLDCLCWILEVRAVLPHCLSVWRLWPWIQLAGCCYMPWVGYWPAVRLCLWPWVGWMSTWEGEKSICSVECWLLVWVCYCLRSWPAPTGDRPHRHSPQNAQFQICCLSLSGKQKTESAQCERASGMYVFV